ncbi:MAG: molybdopterin-dependent oxidoreductase [Dyadobacter fermentans]
MQGIKTFRNKTLLCAMLMCALVTQVHAQTTATLTVSGEVATPLELKPQDLVAMKQNSQKVKDRDGKEHEFKGVALIEILEKAGVTTGAKLRGENLAKYALITAADGHEVLYALAEIDPEFTDQVILLATEKDGQPLPSGEGPFRIITAKDKKPARWIREVRSIKIAFAK